MKAPPLLVALLLFTAAVLGRALLGEYVYDDVPLIRDNPLFDGFADPWAIVSRPLWGDEYGYWRPLTSLMLAVGNTLGGAAGIHALALLVHLAAVAVAYRLAAELTASQGCAIFVAAVFALHPVQVESVAWATAINDPIQGLCALVCLRSAVTWLRHGSDRLPYAVWIAFGMALLAKEVGIVLLPLVALFDLVLRHRHPASAAPRRGRLYAGMVAVALAWAVARILVFDAWDGGWSRAATDPSYEGLRLLTGPVEVLGRLLLVLAVPLLLSPFRELQPDPEVSTMLPALLAIAVYAAFVVLAWRRRHTTALLGLGTVLVVVAPSVLGFQSLGSRPAADRYLYLAVFGFALACVPRTPSRPHFVAGAVLVVLYALVSALQVGVWHDQERLIDHGLSLDPESPALRTMRGDAALLRYRASRDLADLSRSEAEYRHALVQGPVRRTLRGEVEYTSLREARLGLAWCELFRQSHLPSPSFDAAIALFEKVTSDSDAPAEGFVGLGAAYALAGRITAAERSFLHAVALAPHSGVARFNLGRFYSALGRRQQAIVQLQRAVELQPGNRDAVDLLESLR